jgi:hypothetical protein
MAGIELDLIKLEINKYLGIPYFLGGKGTCDEIAKATIDTAKKQKVDLLKLTSKEIYYFQKKNHIGIDCSGLVYHLLDRLYFFKTGLSVFDHLIGTDNQHGPRRISANLFTDKINSFPITGYNDIKTGDLIRVDQGHHVIFIINQDKNVINYVHSSNKTKIAGVHLGQITIVDPQKPLNFQIWSDQTRDGKTYTADGIYRLLLLN